MTLPSIFLSHGSPMLPLTASVARDFLAGLGDSLPRPKAILVISAHWETDIPAVNVVAANETIYDFYGFPRELYQLRYPAPGAPDLALAVAARLQAAGFPVGVDRERGLDHGAWVPLLLMYPQADIPVLQLSIQTEQGPAHHFALGAALRPLRDEGVLIIGAGMSYHNLRQFSTYAPESYAFHEWLDTALAQDEAHRTEALAHWSQAPGGRASHPREEHLLPLMIASGAGSDLPGRRIWRGSVGPTALGAWAFD